MGKQAARCAAAEEYKLVQLLWGILKKDIKSPHSDCILFPHVYAILLSRKKNIAESESQKVIRICL